MSNRLAKIMAAAVTLSASAVLAAPITYTDTQSDQVGSTNKARDIWSVSVGDDTNNLNITINLDPGANIATSAFNYGVGFTTGAGANGDTQANVTTHGNPYNRAISIDSSLGGMTDWIGLFGAGGSGNATSPFTSYGFNTYAWNSTTSAWVKTDTVLSGQVIATQAGGTGPSTVTISVPRTDFANLVSLTPGQTFKFDVYSTGTSAGQTAYDSLADASPTNATNSATVQYNGTVLDTYTIQTVATTPEPASLSLLGVAGLALLKRSRRA